MIPKLSTKSSPRRNDPVGVFDSGVGGLSVLRELRRLMPHERFVFFADQRHVPYGGKTSDQLRRYTSAAVRFLLQHRCKAVVVACNTGTVYAIEHLRNSFPVPFIGTVPAIKPAAAHSVTHVVCILSTPATAVSPSLRQLVRQHAGKTKVLRIGCAGLEELVERGIVAGPEPEQMLRRFLRPALGAGADTVVLGCTHYPFLRRVIARVSRMRIVDSGSAIARRTRAVLEAQNLLRVRGGGSVAYFTNADPLRFSRVAGALLRTKVRSHRADM